MKLAPARLSRVLAPALSLLAAAGVAAAPDVTIADLAPADTFLIAGVDDWAGARAAFERSGLMDLYREPEVQAFIDAFLEEEFDGEDSPIEWLRETIELEELDEPTGPIGLALFPTHETGEDHEPVGALAMSTFGESAEEMEEAIIAILDRLEREGEAELDEREHGGVTIRIVRQIETEEDQAGDEEIADEGEFDGEDDDSGPTELFIARVEGILIAATEPRVLEDAIDRLSGDRIESLRTEERFQAALAQHPAEPHGYAVVLLTDFVREQISGFGEMYLWMLTQGGDSSGLFRALGLTGVQALSSSVRLDTDNAIVEQTFGVLVPEKAGLFSIIDAELARFDPPAFAGPGVLSVGSMAVRFDRVLPMLQAVARAMPEEQQEQAGAFVAAAEPTLRTITNAVGNKVTWVQTLRRPFDAESRRFLIAVEVRDALALSNLITGFAGAAGLEAREFEGNQIFESTQGPSIGIGGGYAFVGLVADIENALRQAARPGSAKLASTPRFAQAAEILRPDAIAYSYSNLSETLAWMQWSTENAAKLYEQQLRDFGIEDPEQIREYVEMYADQQPGYMEKLPSPEVLLRHMGDTVFEMHAAPDGFRGRSVTVRPSR